ncbi:hypothetical protein [Oceanobacillus sp. CFH 90083]|uniref:hypothetical protein n=1 Tax=Oceanobacillus sp. CFH 90083 TaxID=2592336 RepID=UPI00128C95FB|nr:hypothetical protein [Oceanobacillus sp. CFH 90083]
MKKGFVAFIALLSVFFISACSDDSNHLSGKTLKVAYTPILQEDMDNLDKYPSVVTLEFSEGNVASNTIAVEGIYELNDDELVVNFENENEELKITFSDFKESGKDFSMYAAVISSRELQMEDPGQVSHFEGLAYNLSENMPVEFIEN